MWKSSLRLLSLYLCNFWDSNRVRYSKDKKDKMRYRAMLILYGILAIILESYIIGSMWGYYYLGVGWILPMYGVILSSILILVLNYFKAGNFLFQLNSLDTLVALPVPRSAIVLSRVLYIYILSLGLSGAILIPGMLLYGIGEGMGILYYVLYLLGIFLVPLLPVSIAIGIGGVAKAIASRMKHKSLVESIIIILIAVGILGLTSKVNMYGNIELDIEQIEALTRAAVEIMSKIYPLSLYFVRGVLYGDIMAYSMFAGISVGVFAVVFLILIKFFRPICAGLSATYSTKSYSKVEGNQSSVIRALVVRELRYYVSHSVYLMNTIMGPVLMVAAAVGICVTGWENITAGLPFEIPIKVFLPFALSLCGILMPTTSCSISLEGKERWITKSLPISEKLQYDSKLFMYWIVCAPFYVISVAVSAFYLKFYGMELVWLLLIPVIYFVFSGVVGIWINLKFPKFDWENETQVVKQGIGTLISMLISIIAVIVPAVLAFLAGDFYRDVELVCSMIAILCITLFLYLKNCRTVV